jgi:putative transposase
MPNFRRYYLPNRLVFITCVTHDRCHYLEGERNLLVFWETLRNVQAIHLFHLFAYVILPDHFHWILQLPECDPNFSHVLHSVKSNFARNLRFALSIQHPINVWQDRFWDHVIRDEMDLKNHLDYIHWNPVKHSYASQPEDWKESSYDFWLKKGVYGGNGGNTAPDSILKMDFE